jgi:ACT domain-containing protein
VASNWLVLNKDQNNHNYQKVVPVRYLKDTKTKLFNDYPYQNDLSKSTFFKYSKITGQYKNPHRYENF